MSPPVLQRATARSSECVGPGVDGRRPARVLRAPYSSLVRLSNLLSIAVLAVVYGTVFKVQDFSNYVVYLGIGLVVWNEQCGNRVSA